MRVAAVVFGVTLAAEAVLAAPMRAGALPLTLVPAEFKDFTKRRQPSAQEIAANGQPCGIGENRGVCDNGSCGTFAVPTGFNIIRGAEAQCGGK